MARLRIAVVDDDRDRAMLIVDGLADAGDFDVTVIGDSTGLARKLAALAPDVVLVDLASPSRDVLEQVAVASDATARPVAMFVDQSDATMIRAAIEAGVSAYVVDGLKRERIRAILDTAISRFHAFHRLRAELDATKAALAERKTIDRARGLLMASRNISEAEAYALLRKTAMDRKKRIGEIAEALVTAAELLK